MKEKKEKYIPLLVTLLLHLALIILLAFITLEIADREEEEESGVPVLIGNVADSGGMDMDEIPETTESIEETTENTIQEELIPEQNIETEEQEPIITQESEESINIEETDEEKKNAEEEALKEKEAEEERLRAEEEARIRAEEEAKRIAEEEARKKAEEEEAKRQAAAALAQNKISSAFGKTNNTPESSGNTEGNKNQGTPEGNAATGAMAGNGGIGTDAIVGSRSVLHLEIPTYNDHTSEGTIVVAIVVNKAGKVTSASIRRSFTTSTVLRNAAIEAAKKSTFSPGSNETEAGTITYRFKLRGSTYHNSTSSGQINM
jgi:TonB family protein